MTSPIYGDFCFPFLSESSSSMCELPENGSLFPELQSLDPISSEGCGNVLLNNDFTFTTCTLQRKRRGQLSKNSSSCEFLYAADQFVTKTKNHFKFKDEFLPDVDKELPEVILASPCKENTRDSITGLPRDQYFNNKHVTDSKSALPLHDDNPILETTFDDVFKKVKHEMDLRNDSVTNDDIEYLEDILAGVLDYSPHESLLPPMAILKGTEKENFSSVPCSFNEISCNLNSQPTMISDCQSAIKTLLTSDSFKGNFEKKRSTEILSEMDKSIDHLFEHNYCVVDYQRRVRFPEIYAGNDSSADRTVLIVHNTSTESNLEPEKIPYVEVKTEPTIKLEKEDHSVKISSNILCNRVEKPTAGSNDNNVICGKPTTFAQLNLKSEPFAMNESSSGQDIKPTNDYEKCGNGNVCDLIKNSDSDVLDIHPISDVVVNEPVVPKKEKKVISVEEYLKKRIKKNVSDIKSGAASQSNGDSKIEIIKTDKEPVPAISNVVIVENVLKNILKAKSHKNKINEPLNTTNGRKMKQEPRPSLKFERKPKPIIRVERKLSSESINGKEMKFRPVLESKTENKIKLEPPSDSDVEKSKLYSRNKKSSSTCSTTFSPNEISHSLDSCDQCSSSGVSSYHNSSVSSLCGSPFTTSDEKSNDTKYQENGKAIKVRNESVDVPLKESPFAVNMELLRSKDHHSSRRKHKHQKSRRHRKDSRSSRRHYRRSSPDSCYDYDSDSSYSGKVYSRKRRRSSSSSSSSADRNYYSSHTERSLSPKSYQAYVDWNYGKPGTVSEATVHYNAAPNVFYPPMPPAWHPEYAYYQPYPVNFEAPYYYDNRIYETEKRHPSEIEIQNRVLFVGNIERNDINKEEFKKRFSRFGKIEKVKLRFKENGNNFGFVYYAHTEDVHRAMKHGNDDPNLPQYSYGYGGRKERKDEPIFFYEKGYPPPEFVPFGQPELDSFDLKLKQFKSELSQKKITAQSSKPK